MMQKLATLLLLTSVSFAAFGQVADSLDRYAGLDSLLTQFYTTLERAETEEKNSEFDNLIELCRDSLTRQHVTLAIFDHYSHSRVMGEEAVAIHIYDEWIKNGRVKTRSEFEDMEKEIFAEFNRNSLIGMIAPPVKLYKPCGGCLTIPEKGKPAILFFYATDCMKCRLELAELPKILDNIPFKVNFYAINTSTDRKDWNAVRRNLKTSNRNVAVKHLWDPEIDSGYQKLYGVTGTPKIFVVLEDGEIFGRRLELDNLQEIINYISIVYGKKEEK